MWTGPYLLSVKLRSVTLLQRLNASLISLSTFSRDIFSASGYFDTRYVRSRDLHLLLEILLRSWSCWINFRRWQYANWREFTVLETINSNGTWLLTFLNNSEMFQLSAAELKSSIFDARQVLSRLLPCWSVSSPQPQSHPPSLPTSQNIHYVPEKRTVKHRESLHSSPAPTAPVLSCGGKINLEQTLEVNHQMWCSNLDWIRE